MSKFSNWPLHSNHHQPQGGASPHHQPRRTRHDNQNQKPQIHIRQAPNIRSRTSRGTQRGRKIESYDHDDRPNEAKLRAPILTNTNQPTEEHPMSCPTVPATAAMWTGTTTNTKTGDIPTLWVGSTREESQASCKGCPLLENGCYAQGGTPSMAHSSMIRAAKKGKR